MGRLEVGWEKVACWSTKAAISLKRVKIEEELLWGAYRKLGTPQHSFERYHPLRPPLPRDWGSQIATLPKNPISCAMKLSAKTLVERQSGAILSLVWHAPKLIFTYFLLRSVLLTVDRKCVCKYEGQKCVRFVAFSDYFCDTVGVCCSQKERGILLQCLKKNNIKLNFKWQ